jgi:hypothetical protein
MPRTSTTTSGAPTSRAAKALERLKGEDQPTVREAVFWAVAAADARDWTYALKWLDIAEEQGASAPRTISQIRREWSLARERTAA